MNEKPIPLSELSAWPEIDQAAVDIRLKEALAHFPCKIVVLDDDPTGAQTVHGVSEFTDWQESSFDLGFGLKESIFYVLTNSRGLPSPKVKEAYADIAVRTLAAAGRASAGSVGTMRASTERLDARQTIADFLYVCRSDSTLRGHFPLETEILRESLETISGTKIDGEILYPFFKEGGRFTIHDIHYVLDGGLLIPAGQSEFARDKSFGYTASHLGEWCEEKTQGLYKAKDMVYISLETLRKPDVDKIYAQLMGVENFNKVIVNSIDYPDVKVFCTALIAAIQSGKRFIVRGAASVTKVLGGIDDRPLLTRDELIPTDRGTGGIILAGSHVQKTTMQLEALKNCRKPIRFIEFNQHLVLTETGLAPEVERIAKECNTCLREGDTAAIYTRRERLDPDTDDPDAQLALSDRISDALANIIKKLNVRPSFIITKGGNTSSNVAIKALGIHRAAVLGQIQPGIPVWQAGSESKFPGMPLIIFPGNVGQTDTLRDIVDALY